MAGEELCLLVCIGIFHIIARSKEIHRGIVTDVRPGILVFKYGI